MAETAAWPARFAIPEAKSPLHHQTPEESEGSWISIGFRHSPERVVIGQTCALFSRFGDHDVSK
jgi:hypothetical protein